MKNFAKNAAPSAVILSAVIFSSGAIATAQTHVGSQTHVTGNQEFAGRITTSAKVYRTPRYTWVGGRPLLDVFGGVELQMTNQARNAAGENDIGAVRILGGQWKYAADNVATNYGLISVDVGGKRMLTRSLQDQNKFFVTYYYDSGWQGGTISFIHSVGMEARMQGVVSTFVDLSTTSAFGIFGQARAYSYAKGMSRRYLTIFGFGANYYSNEMHGEVQTRLDGVAVTPTVAHGRAWHDKRPSRILFERVSRFLLFSSTAVLLDLRDPALTETWFQF